MSATPLSETINGIVALVPQWAEGGVLFLAVAASFYLVAAFIVKPIARRVMKQRSEHLSNPFAKIAFYLTIIVGIAVGLTASGYGRILSVFGTIMAAGTLAIGLAMRDTISGAVAGFFLLIDKPFEIGDWIEWEGNEGKVKDINLRTTKIETFNNELLTVPNDKLANAVVKNPVANDKLRIVLDIGIGYEDDIDEAKTIIEEIMNDIERIAEKPAPDVRLLGLGDSTVDLKARYWINDPSRGGFVAVKEQMLEQIKERFDAADIDMPYPTITIAGESLNLQE